MIRTSSLCLVLAGNLTLSSVGCSPDASGDADTSGTNGAATDATTGGTSGATNGTNGGANNGGATNGGATSAGSMGSGTTGGNQGASTGDTNTGTTGGADAGVDPNLTEFSFFVTSLSAMRQLSGSQNGFGGDLRFGETGEGAGLRGADKICSTIADMSMPGSSKKQWHAFLSTTTVDAKDRIGTGPWYDRLGRLVAQDLNALLSTRPMGAASEIANDLPNETGQPNQAGSAEGSADDNHDTVTATGQDGTHDGTSTCSDWTSTSTPGKGPRVGHSWPAMSGQSWSTAHTAPGCAPSVNLVDSGAGSGSGIGNGGGYGGIYCFALSP